MRALPPEVTVTFGLDDAEDEAALRAAVAKAVGASPGELPELRVLKRSIDARRGQVRFHTLVELRRDSGPVALGAPAPREVSDSDRVLVVGDGPAGLFCAYELARRGVGAIVLDRGKAVQPRRHDLKALNRWGNVDADSNYCFGEGGAGTYSDGKLYTRSHKRGSVRDVLELLALHGAPESVLWDARPHIGSNRLPKVVTALRERLEAVGVAFRFGARVVELLTEVAADGARAVAGVRLADGTELAARHAVFATGHSARDVFELVARAGATLEPKAFAVGVRVEHPQPLIDRIQYGAAAGHPKLSAAAYKLAAQVDDRGVFSFCMCPGGWIVPASTEAGALVVNGMSLTKRASPFANSGLVVSVELEDLERAGLVGPLAGVELQRRLEERAFAAGGGAMRAPATRVSDFLARRPSSTVPDASYIPGLVASDMEEVLSASGLPLADRLRAGLERFGRALHGYASDDGVLVGVETRTSSPVRVVRDATTLEALGVRGLFPAGEGAGYAGGIVSAAVDGMNVAKAIAAARGV